MDSNSRKLENVLGCKWSLSVLLAVSDGVIRPGTLERHINGISKKVLSERLRKLMAYGLLEKHTFPEVPPRTEYSITPLGQKLISVIQQIQSLNAEIEADNINNIEELDLG